MKYLILNRKYVFNSLLLFGQQHLWGDQLTEYDISCSC